MTAPSVTAGEVGTIAVVVAILGATISLLTVRQRSRRDVRRLRQSVARAAAAIAAQLRAGLGPHEALALAADDWPVLGEAAAADRLGEDPTEVWRRQADQPGERGLAELAAAWALCARTGAALAPTLERLADALESDEALAGTVSAELAAARATSRIMAALPGAGLLLGYGMGGDPLGFLLHTVAGRVSLMVGTVLAAVGVLWVERIAARVGREV